MLDFFHQNWWLGMWLETPEIPTILIKSKYTMLYDGRTIFDEWSPIFENKLPWHFRNKKQRNPPQKKKLPKKHKKMHTWHFCGWSSFFILPLFFCFQVVYHHDAGWSKISSSRHPRVALRDQDPTTFLSMLEEFGDLNSWESKVPPHATPPNK